MKKLLLLIISLFSILILTGCVDGVFHVTVNNDGSGDLDYKLSMDSALISGFDKAENPLEEFKKLARKDGFIVSNFKDKGYYGVEAKKHVENISEGMGEELIKFISSTKKEDDVNFNVNKGFLFDTYQIKTNIDLKDMISEEHQSFSTLFLDKVNLKMLLTLPIDVETHNASRILGDTTEKYKTYEWDIIPGQDNEIFLEAKVLNTLNLSLSALLFLVVLGGGIFVITKRAKIRDV